MKATLWRAGLAGALLVLQTTTGGTSGIRPDFLLLFVLFAGMRDGETAGTAWGAVLGAAQDVFSACVPGTHLLTKGLLGFAAGAVREQMDCGNPNTQALIAVVATCAEGAAHVSLLQVFSAGTIAVGPLLAPVLTAAALNGALLPAAPVLADAARLRIARRRAVRRALVSG